MSAKTLGRCVNFHVKDCSSLHLPCLRPRSLSRAHCRTRIDQSQLFLKFNSKYGSSAAITISRNFVPRASSSPDPSTSPWKKWLLGILLTLILPVVGHKGGLFIGLKAKIDKAIETVEHVTEVVEEIAEEADKIVEEVEAKIPGDSKLRKSLDKFDNLAKKAVDEAKKAEDMVYKGLPTHASDSGLTPSMQRPLLSAADAAGVQRCGALGFIFCKSIFYCAKVPNPRILFKIKFNTYWQ